MFIDSKQLSGPCSCGRSHAMTTEFCVIERGCLGRISEYIARAGLDGFCAAVYDENTYHAKGLVRPSADTEIILPADGLHADEHGVALLMERLPKNCAYLIAVGAGTVHDLTRYCAYTLGIPFVSCPTAASVDGFCSSVAAMTWHGFKKTFTAVPPKLVVADLDVIMQAPVYLLRSGFGDMIGKYIALADWRIGRIVTGEYFCQRLCDLTMEATDAVLNSAAGIVAGEEAAYEKLVYGLLLSGLSMQLIGNSRPASGAEHHISHIIEMQPTGLNVASAALHGEKVGVGTLLAAEEYHRLRNSSHLHWADYPPITEDEVMAVYGPVLSGSIIEENANDVARDVTAQRIQQCWPDICAVIDGIPTPETLRASYTALGIKATLGDIDVDDGHSGALMDFSPLVRNRLTLMRLRRCLKKEG